jgi:hypothetical protein
MPRPDGWPEEPVLAEKLHKPAIGALKGRSFSRAVRGFSKIYGIAGNLCPSKLQRAPVCSTTVLGKPYFHHSLLRSFTGWENSRRLEALKGRGFSRAVRGFSKIYGTAGNP